MDAPQSRLAASLRQWCAKADSGARRTAVLRPTHDVDVAAASRDVKEHGAELQSAGAGAITVVASPQALLALAGLDWVRAVEEPRELFTRSSSRL